MIEEYIKTISELKQTLSSEQQKFLSLNSIHNFLFGYEKLTKYNAEVLNLLSEYFEEIKQYNYAIDKRISTEIAFKYVGKIGTYYSLNLGYKLQTTLNFALISGLLLDLILLFTGLLKHFFYIPISTLSWMGYWYYIKKNYEEKNKVYNVKY